MTRIQTEKIKVQHPLLLKLDTYKITGDVIWFQKLSAEDDRYCEAGTLDTIAIIDQKNGCICVMFIECKAPGKRIRKDKESGKNIDNYRFEQRKFVDGMLGKPKIYCCIIDDVKQLYGHLKKAREL